MYKQNRGSFNKTYIFCFRRRHRVYITYWSARTCLHFKLKPFYIWNKCICVCNGKILTKIFIISHHSFARFCLNALKCDIHENVNVYTYICVL